MTVDEAIREFALVFEIPFTKDFRNAIDRFWLDRFIDEKITADNVQEATQYLISTFDKVHYKPQLRHLFKMAHKCRGLLNTEPEAEPPTDEDKAYGILYREIQERWGQGRITTPNMAGITVSLMHLYSILWEGAMLHDFEACCKSGEPNWDTVREVLCDVIGKVRLANPEYAEWLPVVSENAISYRGKVDNIPETESVAAVADLGIPF